MSVFLTETVVNDFDSCVYKELLAYVRYPESDSARRCFAYPQFMLTGDQMDCLSPSAFPDDGCLPMAIASTNSADIFSRYGNVVVMTVNDEEPRENSNYPETELSRFNSIINPYMPKGRSAVEFTKLTNHSLSLSLMQVIEIEERVDLSKPLSAPVHTYSDQVAPMTKLALVAQVVDGKKKYFGPFECTVGPACEVTLNASSAHNLHVVGINASSFNFSLDLNDGGNYTAAQFVSADEFNVKFESAGKKHDWISDDELIEAIGRVARTGEEALSKKKATILKADLKSCAEEIAKIALTPGRRERMISLISGYEDFASIPDDLKSDVIENADPKQLADFVLESEHFKAFYDKVMEVDQVREKVDLEKAKYNAQADAARKAAVEAGADLNKAKAKLQEFEDKLETKKKELEEEVAQATKVVGEERDRLEGEVKTLREEKEALEADKILVQREIRKAVQDMSDEYFVSSKILQNEMIKQIVASVSTPSADEHEVQDDAIEAKEANPILIAIEDEEMDAETLLSTIERRISVEAGRELSRNEIINLMICLSQGFITTLAGLPGTGKTSLASILAGALGLSNEQAPRCIEVSVEKGWTSYKDYIGYYNPFTKSMEKSNVATFDAFEQLDQEAREGISGPPYLFVLDEANLSSIEHYWSPFLRVCDSFKTKNAVLSLGGDDSFEVPGYVRFIATVNFDHTTEELSPRFLDRSWVITLDPEEIDLEGDIMFAGEHDFSQVLPFSYEKLQQIFGAKSNAMLDSDLKSKLKEVTEVCAKHHHSVSPRSQKMIWDYACTAAQLMDRASAQTAYAPVDYAVAQKILPLLSGSEERLEDLLLDLSKIGGLPITKARVDHMLETGKDSGFYQYFA